MTFQNVFSRPLISHARASLAVLALACFAASAQAPTDVRVALVIGNAAYPGSASLANPVNDATAMAATLRTLGFSVVELKDGSRDEISQAIARVGESLKGRQGIGMLYYAGHGLQVDFRNYMVPVDAKLASAADVPLQTVDVGRVVDAFKSAGNRMNLVVLDACRDNPFAQATGKGLAPLDAPSGTLLAYATAPGNVAEDGDTSSGHGLYTRYLVQELQKPAVRIEDVFKRVRLQVRRESQGRQIPWESTSLEEDFYFNDGVKFTFRADDLLRVAQASRERQDALERAAREARELEAKLQAQLTQRAAEARRQQETEEAARLARAAQARAEQALAAQRADEARRQREMADAAQAARDAERQKGFLGGMAREEAFRAEKAEWDRIRETRNPDDLYAFLTKFPSGALSEMAQGVLQRLQDAGVRTAPGREGVPQVPAHERFRLGDVYSYQVRDELTKRIRPLVLQVEAVDEDRVVLGPWLYTREGAVMRNDNGVYDPPRMEVPAGDYVIGKQWTIRNTLRAPDGTVYISGTARVVALEEVEVPAGRFLAYRVEVATSNQMGTSVQVTRWMRPEWGLPVKWHVTARSRANSMTQETYEMVRPVRAL